MRQRNRNVSFRLSEREFAELNKKVQSAGMTKEHYLRKIINGSRVYEAPPVDFPKLIKEVNRVGSNIDQILRIANTKNLIDVPRLRKELDELDRIEDAMWRAFAPDGR